jgi:hypothetical protein
MPWKARCRSPIRPVSSFRLNPLGFCPNHRFVAGRSNFFYDDSRNKKAVTQADLPSSSDIHCGLFNRWNTPPP